MPLSIPYNQLPDLGILESTDLVPMLRPFQDEGKASMADLGTFVQPYTKIIGNLNQTTSGAAPNLYLFENTSGAVFTISFLGSGVYQLTSDLPIFIYEYLWIYIGNEQNMNGDWSFQMTRNDDYNLTIYSYSNFVLTDFILKFTSFEIRIYPTAP